MVNIPNSELVQQIPFERRPQTTVAELFRSSPAKCHISSEMPIHGCLWFHSLQYHKKAFGVASRYEPSLSQVACCKSPMFQPKFSRNAPGEAPRCVNQIYNPLIRPPFDGVILTSGFASGGQPTNRTSKLAKVPVSSWPSRHTVVPPKRAHSDATKCPN